MIKLSHRTKFVFRPVHPYDFELTIKKPAGWSWFTPYERWDKGTIRSGFWFAGLPIGVKARSAGKSLIIDIYAGRKLSPEETAKLKHLMSESLGVSEDLRPFYKLMGRHPMLKGVAKHLYGMHEGWGMNIFSSLTLAILLQMAPIKRSQQMWDCLIKNYGRQIGFDGQKILLWPDEKTIAACEPRALAAKCRLGYRAKFLVRMARQLVAGFPGVDELAALTPEAANDKLMELFGVGEYTAGFASPHPSFSLDVWSIKIFYPILFGRHAPRQDPRSCIAAADREAVKRWGDWRGLVLVYVLNDLDYLAREFRLPIK